MGQATGSVSQSSFGSVLPPDVLGAAVDRLNDIVLVTDSEPSDGQGYRVLFVNPAFERITGYAAEEVLGRTLAFLHGPETSADQVAHLEAAVRERRPVRGEILNYRKDGSPLWLEIEASPLRSPSTGAEYFVFIERDISGRKRSEADNREHERSVAAMLSNLPGMAYRCLNDGSRTMEFVSDGCRDLTGHEPDELVANRVRAYEALIDEEDRRQVQDIVRRAVERREPFEITYRIRARDGSIKWVWDRGRSVPGADSKPREIEGFITDITERKLLEAQVVQNQRLESVGTLAGGIAHDLNNVFAPIMMAGDLLTDKTGEADMPQLLEVISASARRGAELVRQILLFARGMEGSRVSIAPAILFADLKTFLDSTFPKNIRVTFSIAPDAMPIAGDPTQLHQVLLSLAVNARDAMPAGGRLAITASTASVSPSGPRPHPDAVPGTFTRVDVTDTGCGIPDILKGQIFDPFFTTKGVGSGSGLGLSTARSIVKAHCGFITLASTEGIGTTFSVFLPTADAGLTCFVRGEAPRTNTGPLPRGSGQSILVVDDEDSVRVIMRSTLESFGYRAIVASDGAEAVSLFRSDPGMFDMAIVDMQMPGLDGNKTIITLRHLRPELPIVGASGLATGENKEKAAASGVKHFLDKPFSVETLIRTVHAAMSKAM